jgi:hypothetical protein
MDQTAEMTAAGFRFLCQPSSPRAAKPVAKSGRVEGYRCGRCNRPVGATGKLQRRSDRGAS